MDYKAFINTATEIRSGKPCIRDTRVTVTDVLEYLAGGMSENEILRDFPYLTRDDIRACLDTEQVSWLERRIERRAVDAAITYRVSTALFGNRFYIALLAGREPLPPAAYPARHRWMDAVLLRVLDRNLTDRAELFVRLFGRNPPHRMLRFLDGETRIGEELALMASSPQWPMIRAATQDALWRLAHPPPRSSRSSRSGRSGRSGRSSRSSGHFSGRRTGVSPEK